MSSSSPLNSRSPTPTPIDHQSLFNTFDEYLKHPPILEDEDHRVANHTAPLEEGRQHLLWTPGEVEAASKIQRAWRAYRDQKTNQLISEFEASWIETEEEFNDLAQATWLNQSMRRFSLALNKTELEAQRFIGLMQKKHQEQIQRLQTRNQELCETSNEQKRIIAEQALRIPATRDEMNHDDVPLDYDTPVAPLLTGEARLRARVAELNAGISNLNDRSLAQERQIKTLQEQIRAQEDQRAQQNKRSTMFTVALVTANIVVYGLYYYYSQQTEEHVPPPCLCPVQEPGWLESTFGLKL